MAATTPTSGAGLAGVADVAVMIRVFRGQGAYTARLTPGLSARGRDRRDDCDGDSEEIGEEGHQEGCGEEARSQEEASGQEGVEEVGTEAARSGELTSSLGAQRRRRQISESSDQPAPFASMARSQYCVRTTAVTSSGP